MTVQEFINKTYIPAENACSKYGLPVLFAIAQSALETGWGKSVPGNMYFGIKAGSNWKGKKQLLWTTEYINGKHVQVQDYFRAYDTVQQSFEDWANLLTSNSRYKAALTFKDNPNEFAVQIHKAGYATDPDYSSKIISIMNTVKKKYRPDQAI